MRNQLGTVPLIMGIVLASISISSCIISEAEITYEVMLDTPQETTFFIPLPIDNSNGDVADLINELKIVSGSADWKIVDSIHGKALEVRTNTKSTLSARKRYGYKGSEKGDKWLSSYSISMLGEKKQTDGWTETYEAWVYASSGDTTARISLRLDDGWNNDLRYNIGQNGNDPFGSIPLKEGWQKVNLERVMVLYD